MLAISYFLYNGYDTQFRGQGFRGFAGSCKALHCPVASPTSGVRGGLFFKPRQSAKVPKSPADKAHPNA